MKRLLVESEKCLACRSCEIACAVEHSCSQNIFEAVDEKPSPEYRIYVEDIQGTTAPLQCRHCESAPCLQVCPSKAIIRKELAEPVRILNNLCVGCSSCIIVCPFGVLKLGKDKKIALKCDLCIERIQENEVPACVNACPTGALKIKTIFSQPDLVGQKQQGLPKNKIEK